MPPIESTDASILGGVAVVNLYQRRLQCAVVTRSTLLVAVGAVLGGIAVLMTALAAAFEPLLLFVAVPFGVAGYLIWFQGTGRLAARVRRRANATDRARAAAGDAGPGSGDGPRWADPGAQERRARARRRAARASVGAEGPDRQAGVGRDAGAGRSQPTDRMSAREARDVLGVDPDGDEGAVRRAYRRRVKETHPDNDGDEEAFKRVTEAYERLTE